MGLRGGPIVILFAALFLLMIFFNSPLPVLAAVIALMLGYSYWKWKNKCSAAEDVRLFVASHIKPEMIWPSKIVISEKSLQELNEKLAGKKIVLPRGTLNKMVEDTLVKQIESRFEASFYEHNKDLPQNPSLNQWIQAYVGTFKKNMDHVPLLKRLMKKKGINVPVKVLKEKVTEEMIKQGQLRKKSKVGP